MKGPRCDEQNMVRIDRPVFGGHRGPFDQGQQIALNAFAADIGAAGIGAGADLVNFVQKHNAVFLNSFQCGTGDGFIIQ